ncbi:hypothetical protein JQ617_03340 [Bradyrhizobium sp. KB893862 SZCCT0404]|uniref:hypothetical protein n=1 Tax=Bradyrhizobium sp. KB893862 SZCCT0404 TaxID=2807672 RepID=UPI001BAAD3E5|nr:hypothetical protein [Bradyrhizobium sp. KB893862 SZCCT0404]MBR1172979.1 hypothetical protein [Bradyrhizobium sp. KB893862 SZCCT0404]
MKQSPSDYRGKTDFPNEAFVQQAVEQWLTRDGFRVFRDRLVDVKASRDSGGEPKVWHIEAKGKTSAVGLDFRTGVGQLVQRMKDRAHQYGIAIPDIPEFRKQTDQFAPWVLSKLQIHWIWVSKDGTVSVDTPPQ